ncbi:hypothetical protein CCH79_00020173, partial [Gambusia affinis]
MTTFTFGFLTLCTWIISSGTWSGLDQPTEFRQDEQNEALSISCKRSVLHISNKTKPTLAFKGGAVSLLCVLHDSWLHLLHNVNETEEKRGMCKCEVLQFEVHFLSKTVCLLHKMEVEAAVRCAQTTSFVQLHHWRTVYSFNIFKEGNPKSNILQDSVCADFKTGLLNCQILKLCAVSSDVSDRVCQRVCCCKIFSMLFPASCSKEACMLQEEMCSFHVCTKTWNVHSVCSRCVGRFFLATGLLVLIYTNRLKTNSAASAPDSNATVGMLLTTAMRRSSDWFWTAFHLVCVLAKTINVLIVCKAVHLVLNRFLNLCLKSMPRPVTVLIFLMTFNITLLNTNLRHGFLDVSMEGRVESALRPLRVVLAQFEFLASLYCLFALLPFLLQFILTKLNYSYVLLHLQLVTHPQRLQTPR